MKTGSYCIILYINKKKRIRVGALGNILFKKGYYCYTGSAMNNLDKRIERHCQLESQSRKKIRWHIDYLRESAQIASIIKIKSLEKTEDIISKKIEEISEDFVNGFGSSDSFCKSHLFYFKKNPHKKIISAIKPKNKPKKIIKKGECLIEEINYPSMQQSLK